MGILLQNTEKPDKRRALMGVGFSLDLVQLDACFGGFSPMALSDGIATQEQIFESEKRVREMAEARKRAAAIEAARASELRTYADSQGTIWHYVLLDGEQVRIEKCDTSLSVLDIPSFIEDKPVVAFAPDACAYLPSIEEIICPDTVLSIGFGAFRGNDHLKKIRFPEQISEYDYGWVRFCDKVEHLILPGQLPKLDTNIFDLPNLRILEIGAGTNDVAAGAFAKSQLETLIVNENNVFIKTDGKALYTYDGSGLICLAIPQERYEVAEGCKVLARKAFSNFSCLKEVALPESLEVMGGFCLANSSITKFVAPASLRVLGEKAFFNCTKLDHIALNEGLAIIEQNAFTNTGITQLVIPASIQELGYPIAERTGLVFSGEGATFRIAANSQNLYLDNAGGLYKDTNEGKCFVRLMDPYAMHYEVASDTVIIGEKACLGHPNLQEIVLPEGLQVIKEAAFRDCRKLVQINIPTTLELIEAEALMDTNIVSLYIPKSLVRIGQNALVTQGAHTGSKMPSLRTVTVDADNPRFRTYPGMLLERFASGNERLVLSIDNLDVVNVPDTVTSVGAYAFNGVRGVRELSFSDRVANVEMRGMALGEHIEWLHIRLVEPYKGHASVSINFPDTDRSNQQQQLALGVPDHVDVGQIFEYYDASIVTGSSFDPKFKAGMTVYDQGKRILERLLDPIYLRAASRSLFEGFLNKNLGDLCVEITKHDDRKSINALLDLGYVNAENIYEIIDRVGAVQDAAMTGYLLEVKRERFEQDPFDFDL